LNIYQNNIKHNTLYSLYFGSSNDSNDYNNYNKALYNTFYSNIFNKNFNYILLYYNLFNNDMIFSLDSESLSFNSNIDDIQHFDSFNDIQHFKLFNNISNFLFNDISNSSFNDISDFDIPNFELFYQYNLTVGNCFDDWLSVDAFMHQYYLK